jgi:Zn-dependent protease with chaperone function
MSDLDVRFFDGHSSRPHAARLRAQGDELIVEGDDFTPLSVPLAEVRWPERTRHGARMAHLPRGASVQSLNVPAWDAWTARFGRREGWVVRSQQSWRGVLAAFAALIVAGAVIYQWGLPWVARGVTALVPHDVDEMIGEEVLETLDRSLLEESGLPEEEQERLRDAFARMVEKAHPDDAPPWTLEFRRGGDKRLGPNALALPGGTIILTDELVALLPDDDDAVLGVLAHEFGHVRLRHGMRQLVQVSALGMVVSAAFGDYGTLITTAPVALATLGYSRDAEREADAESLRLMRIAGVPPSAMADFFEAIEAWRQTQRGDQDNRDKDGDIDFIGLTFSSHPATAQRIAFFRDAARE